MTANQLFPTHHAVERYIQRHRVGWSFKDAHADLRAPQRRPHRSAKR